MKASHAPEEVARRRTDEPSRLLTRRDARRQRDGVLRACLAWGVLAAVLTSAGCAGEPAPAVCDAASTPDARGLRADAPAYAVHGPFWVGHRRFETASNGVGETLTVKAWYPAANPSCASEEITYQVAMKSIDWQAYAPQVIRGHAILDAPFADVEGPRPLVVFSHGYSLGPEWYATLLEHYASHGFVVLAPEHVESDWFQAWAASFDRPRDIEGTLDLAEELTAAGGALAGKIDVGSVAVAGHSYGGYTALAMAGAQIDFDGFNAGCAALAPDDPKAFLCAPFLGREQDMAARAGLSSVPEGLWPSLGDTRVKAVLPMAGDAYLLGSGLASVTVPVMAMGGTADSGTPWEWGALLAYRNVASAEKALVGFENAGHMIPAQPCSEMPFSEMFSPLEYEFICLEPVWDKLRALDLINHFSTAFLLDVLAGDAAAHEALLPPAVQLPGIAYTTTLW